MPTFKRYKKKRRTKKVKNRRKNRSYKKRKMRRRTRKKKMKGAGHFQQVPGIIGGWEFVPTPVPLRPPPDKIPITPRQLSTMQTIYQRDSGRKKLPTEIPDESFYSLYQGAMSEIAQQEQSTTTTTTRMLPTTAMRKAPTTVSETKSGMSPPSENDEDDADMADINDPIKNQKLIDMAHKQTAEILLEIKQRTTGKQAAFSIDLTGVQIIALFNESSCTISTCPNFHELIRVSLQLITTPPVHIDWNDPNDDSDNLSIRLHNSEIAALNKNMGSGNFPSLLQETISCPKLTVGLVLYNENGYFCPLGIDAYENLVNGVSDLEETLRLTFIPYPSFHNEIESSGFINSFNPPDQCTPNWQGSFVFSRSLIEFTREETSEEKEARLKQLEEAVKRPEPQGGSIHQVVIPPFLTEQTTAAEQIITTTVEDVGLTGRIPTSALVQVEEVSSTSVGDLASTNDNIHDVTGPRFPTGREAELVNVRTALAITQAEHISNGLQEMASKIHFLRNAPRGNNRDAAMAQRSLCQLLKQAQFCIGKTIEGTATDQAVKDMYKQTLMDRNCINTMLTVCPLQYNHHGIAHGVVLIPVYSPNGSTCDNVLNFMFTKGYRGDQVPMQTRGDAFLKSRDRLMATISRFPPGALFYGPVMSTKLAMNTQSTIFPPQTQLQPGITFNPEERIPIDMVRAPLEQFLIYDPRKNDNMKLLIDYLVENRIYRNPTVFLKKLIKLAEDETASVRRTQIYCSPIDYKSVGQNATLLHVASRDSLYFPLGVNGWSTGSPFTEKEWTSQELLGDRDLIKPKLIRGLFLFFNTPEGQQIISHIGNSQSLLTSRTNLHQQQRILGQQAQKEALSQQQQEEAYRINQSIIQIESLLRLNGAISNTLASGQGQEFFKETDFLKTVGNPFWDMILTSLKVPIKMSYSETDYPFYDFLYIAPKNLITDQVSSNNNGVARTFRALNTCGIYEGEVCYASSNGAYLPTLQTARAADHAASQHQQNARHRINQAMITYEQMKTYAGYKRLRKGAIGNPLYALNLGFTIRPSLGFATLAHAITVIQKRASTSLSKEWDPAFLFGESFYAMINATTCSSCEPCSTTTTTDLLHTCLPNLTAATVSKRTRTCKFTCSGCSNTSPLLKWQVGAQNVTNKGSKTRAKTCFCDCYQEEYYNPVILQGEQQKYQTKRDQLCRGTVGPLNMVHDNMSGPYNNDQALYNFIKRTRQSWIKDGLPKKYAQFNYSVGVCTKKCGCQGKCLGNRMRARKALDAFKKLSADISAEFYTVDPKYNWVSLYINGASDIERQNHMTNVYCLVSILFEQMVIDTQHNTIIIKEPLNGMLQNVFGDETNAAVTKILFNQLFWSHAHITTELGGKPILFPTSQGYHTFANIMTAWTAKLPQTFYSPTSQFLLLKFLLNSIVIGVPSVKNLTLYQTANVETVIGNIDINESGEFYSTDNKATSVEVDYKGTSAAEASGKFMDSLKNNPSAWIIRDRSPRSLSIHVRKRHAGGKGKEIGDYGQEITAFAGEATCLTGDLNAFNRPGLAKRVSVTCRNTSLTSREMTDNIRERGDGCFQLFSKPHGTNPNLSLIAIQVLQVAPVPQEVMAAVQAAVPAADRAIKQRVKRLTSIVKKGNVSVLAKKQNNL